jgi:hypothetical protein
VDPTTSRSSRSQVRHLADLLRLTACSDLPELVELVDSQMQMRPLTLDVQANDVRIEAHTEAGGYVLELPILLGRFWRTVDLLDADLEHRAAAEQLPRWSAQGRNEDVTVLLAEFFDVILQEFVANVGGRWCAQDPDELVGLNEAEYRWFGSGVPMQVLLGVGTDEAVVAEPIMTAAGLRGPARLERGRAESVLLRRRDTLRRLSEHVRDMEAFVQSQFTYCPGCRTTVARGGSGDVCVDCHWVYFGTIFD